VSDKLVIDSSVAIKCLCVEPHTTEALKVLDEYQNGLIELHAPEFIFAEIGNIIWKKHRFQGVTFHDAELMIKGFQRLSIESTPTSSLFEPAFRLAVTHGRSVYDMLYLALSIRESCRCVTADEKLVNAIGGDFPDLLWVGNWP
jgi:predicted nucleic acid-binding protein